VGPASLEARFIAALTSVPPVNREAQPSTNDRTAQLRVSVLPLAIVHENPGMMTRVIVAGMVRSLATVCAEDTARAARCVSMMSMASSSPP